MEHTNVVTPKEKTAVGEFLTQVGIVWEQLGLAKGGVVEKILLKGLSRKSLHVISSHHSPSSSAL
jgi:hypothetical protein